MIKNFKTCLNDRKKIFSLRKESNNSINYLLPSILLIFIDCTWIFKLFFYTFSHTLCLWGKLRGGGSNYMFTLRLVEFKLKN